MTTCDTCVTVIVYVSCSSLVNDAEDSVFLHVDVRKCPCFLSRTVSMFYFNDVALDFFISVEFDSMIILAVGSPLVSSDEFIAKEFQTFTLVCDCLELRDVLVLIAPVHQMTLKNV